jgi:hypothetical protein
VNGAKNEKFKHGMKDLCEELDKRIDKLDKFRARLQKKVDDGINVEKNKESLSRVNNSLKYSKEARTAMESSCCGYSCEYELHEQ